MRLSFCFKMKIVLLLLIHRNIHHGCSHKMQQLLMIVLMRLIENRPHAMSEYLKEVLGRFIRNKHEGLKR